MLYRLLDKHDIVLDSETIGKLESFAEILHEWNHTHNLTGAKNIEAIYDNILDSAYPLTFISTPQTLLDVGTGAGFPGLVLGIIWHQSRVVLCEPINKRAAFLKYVVMELGLGNITVSKMRVEDLRHEPFDLVSSRAVTDTGVLLKITDHLTSDKTQYLFYKGSRTQDELSGLKLQPNYVIVHLKKRKYLWIK